jgi:serine/threonine protein phosphatase PrpC
VRVGRAAAVSDAGRRRLRNEDAFVCEPPFFAVADGMGGARAGEIAARLAATALEESATDARGQEDVVELILEANRRIWERALADPSTAGMGTTVTAALVDEASGEIAIGHVGDSRMYRLRDGALEQLTTDHSLVAELVQSGVLTPEEAENHPQRSAITRALGTDPSVEVEAFTAAVLPGDVYLLCSDGLSTMLGDDELAAALGVATSDPGEAAEQLVEAANARGGEDNITVVLFEITEGEAPPREARATTSDGRAGSDGAGENDGAVEIAHAEVGPTVSVPDVNRHGAGPGGQLAALVLILAVLAVAALALYWGVK